MTTILAYAELGISQIMRSNGLCRVAFPILTFPNHSKQLSLEILGIIR